MLRQLRFRVGVVRFGGCCPIKWFWPVSRVLIGVLFINTAQAKMTNQQGRQLKRQTGPPAFQVRKGHSQQATADSPAKYLIAATTNGSIGPTDDALTSPDEIRAEAQPHTSSKKIRPHQREWSYDGQVVPAIFRSVPSMPGAHAVSLDVVSRRQHSKPLSRVNA